MNYNQSSKIWSDLNRYQTDFCFAQELATYYTIPSWGNSRHVIDIGAGNGYYIKRLASVFPNKCYTGVDISEDAISIARSDPKGIEFSVCDVAELSGQYDFAIMRLLLQHLPFPERALESVANIMATGSGCLVIDAYDSLRYFYPEVPKFCRMFEEYTRRKASKNLDRSICGRLPDIISDHPSWNLVDDRTITVPSSVNGNRTIFKKTYALIIELIQSMNLFDHDFESVKKEWKNWCELDDSYTQVGLKVMLLERT